MLFERRAGRRWVRVQRKRIAVTGGAFSTIVRPPVPGRYRLYDHRRRGHAPPPLPGALTISRDRFAASR